MRPQAPQQDAYLASRAEALQNVERTIVELGTIFTQLATMVAEQGELAIRIDENVDVRTPHPPLAPPPPRVRAAGGVEAPERVCVLRGAGGGGGPQETLSNVEAAQTQLLKYFSRISSNRYLILKVLGVLMLFMIFFVVFVA